MRKSNVRKLSPKPQLTDAEVQRITQKLASELEHDGARIGILTLLFDHLQHLSDNDPSLLWGSIYTIKTHLFVGTTAADQAQEQFQDEAYANRGKLLMWPYESEATK